MEMDESANLLLNAQSDENIQLELENKDNTWVVTNVVLYTHKPVI